MYGTAVGTEVSAIAKEILLVIANLSKSMVVVERMDGEVYGDDAIGSCVCW